MVTKFICLLKIIIHLQLVIILFLQEAIPRRIQQDIITELRTPDRLRETLDIVEIVLGFLTSGGGNPKVPLKRYINAHKMNKKSFSAKVCDQ